MCHFNKPKFNEKNSERKSKKIPPKSDKKIRSRVTRGLHSIKKDS